MGPFIHSKMSQIQDSEVKFISPPKSPPKLVRTLSQCLLGSNVEVWDTDELSSDDDSEVMGGECSDEGQPSDESQRSPGSFSANSNTLKSLHTLLEAQYRTLSSISTQYLTPIVRASVTNLWDTTKLLQSIIGIESIKCPGELPPFRPHLAISSTPGLSRRTTRSGTPTPQICQSNHIPCSSPTLPETPLKQ